MATLENLSSGERAHLAARHLVGRSKTCHLCIPRPNVSGLHAEIVWDGSSWQVQDLGSRNGTFVGSRKLAAGELAALEAGMELMFGVRSNRFRLVDASPPKLMALADNGDVNVADGDIMCLPSPEACEVSIFRDAEHWQAETSESTWAIQDQDLIVAGGRAWRVCLPAVKARTREAHANAGPSLGDIGLEFFVSRDGEYVTMTLKRPDGDVPLEPRAHAFLLLALARCRQADAALEHLPESEHGWMHREELIKELDIDPQLLNLWVYRARKQLAEAGVSGAGGIVERRAGVQQMRIGAHAVVKDS